jgi:hypothetical protein
MPYSASDRPPPAELIAEYLAAIRDGTADIDRLLRNMAKAPGRNIGHEIEAILVASGLVRKRRGRLVSGIPMAVVVTDETWKRLYGA